MAMADSREVASTFVSEPGLEPVTESDLAISLAPSEPIELWEMLSSVSEPVTSRALESAMMPSAV